MSIKLTQKETVQTYFCTFTCLHWLHLFQITDLYNGIYQWFNILLEKGNEIEGFIIMPNHLHILAFVNTKQNINTMLANGKRFLAYEIVKRLKNQNQKDILKELELAVTPKERQRMKKHRVFEASSDIKPCYTEYFLLQKLNYIHNNPVTGKWKLASLPELYPHSSAAYYLLNQPHKSIAFTHYKDVGQRLISASSPAGDDA